jgi:hypothetical protein
VQTFELAQIREAPPLAADDQVAGLELGTVVVVGHR